MSGLYLLARHWSASHESPIGGRDLRLSRKHFTILVVPSDRSRVRRLKLPLPAVGVLAGLAGLGLALFGAGLYTSVADHFRLAKERTERTRLEVQSEAREGQIKLFAAKIEDLEGRLEEMQALGRKLRGMANLREQQEFVAPSPRFSIGGASLEDDRWALGIFNLDDAINDEVQSGLDQLALETTLQEQSLKELNHLLVEKSIRDAHLPSIWPSRGLVTSSFGRRTNPVTHRRQFHTGLDIASRRGTSVYATADGVVIFAGRSGSLGRLVMISHGKGRSRYSCCF